MTSSTKPIRLSTRSQTLRQRLFDLVSVIPKGQTSTYKILAEKIGTHPRVVGMLLHTNTDPVKVPCHRVIKSDGKLARGYAFGGQRAQAKKLKLEQKPNH